MRYVCLVYGEEAKLRDSGPPASECLAYDDELRRNGQHIVSDALQGVRAAASVRVRNGQVAITDGPFAETKEQLLGFILIEASDREEAIKAASKIPAARFGTIEVRPVRELDQEL